MAGIENARADLLQVEIDGIRGTGSWFGMLEYSYESKHPVRQPDKET